MKQTQVVNCIRQLRTERGLTQADLADQIGLTRQTVNAIEQGKYSPSLEAAFRIAQVLEAPFGDVFQYPAPGEKTSPGTGW